MAGKQDSADRIWNTMPSLNSSSENNTQKIRFPLFFPLSYPCWIFQTQIRMTDCELVSEHGNSNLQQQWFTSPWQDEQINLSRKESRRSSRNQTETSRSINKKYSL
jgi:hypothetical protein